MPRLGDFLFQVMVNIVVFKIGDLSFNDQNNSI